MARYYKLAYLLILTTGQLLKCEAPIPAFNNYNVNINIIDMAQLRNSIDFVKMRDDMLKDLGDYLHNLSKQKQQSVLNWLQNHRSALVGTTIATVYAYLAIKIATGKAVLYNNSGWSNWKNDINLSELLTKSNVQISRELNQAILDKYSNNNQAVLITPLLCFNHDLEQELQTLRALSRIGKNLKRVKLKTFFLISDRDLELVDEKINRLLYLKNILNSAIHVSLNN